METWKAYDSSLPDEDIANLCFRRWFRTRNKSCYRWYIYFGMVARSVKDEEKKAIKDEKEYQVGIDALTIAVKNPSSQAVQNC